MKNILFLMLGLIVSTASFAQTTIDKTLAATVSLTSDNKVKLMVAREEATATITLRDSNGNVLYVDKQNLQNGLRQYFNLSQLAHGVYQLSISVGKESIVKTFEVKELPSQQVVTLAS